MPWTEAGVVGGVVGAVLGVVGKLTFVSKADLKTAVQGMMTEKQHTAECRGNTAEVNLHVTKELGKLKDDVAYNLSEVKKDLAETEEILLGELRKQNGKV